MLRHSFRRMLTPLAMLACGATVASADGIQNAAVQQPAQPIKTIVVHRQAAQPAPAIQQTAGVEVAPAYGQAPMPVRSVSTPTGAAPTAGAMPVSPWYPQTNAGMYPAPLPNIPIQSGGTAITNQAFAPHEMLYPHEYRAIYPPYYYKVKGGWIVTPLGVMSHDHWELMGTEVRVKYKSKISPLSRFVPPIIR